MNPKKHILIFSDWYLPGYKAGGPIQSCANLVDRLKTVYNFSIVCKDTDFGETQSYIGITSNEWTQVEEGIRIFYISVDKLNASTIKKLLQGNYDALYLNSLFSVYFTLLPLWYSKTIKKIVLAPRGMFGAGALGVKPLKKKLFLSLSKPLGLYSNVSWQASSVLESNDIKAVFGDKASITIAPNLSPLRTLLYVKREKKVNEIKLFFLSRILPIKNLLAVFDYLEKVDPIYGITFEIIGPIEDRAYWGACLKKIEILKDSRPAIKINYIGSLKNKDLSAKLAEYHCMILPTFNENFGHVILDSLAAGCPVILSDQTPWKNLSERKIGWDIRLAMGEKFVQAIETISAMDETKFNELSLNAFQEAVKYYNNKDLVDQNMKLFE